VQTAPFVWQVPHAPLMHMVWPSSRQHSEATVQGPPAAWHWHMPPIQEPMQQSASLAQETPSDPHGSGSTSVHVELGASQAYPRQHSESAWHVSGLVH